MLYQIDDWNSPEDFLERVAKRTGKLLKGGEPDVNAVSKMILNDWQRGKIPYFNPPEGHNSEVFNEDKAAENAEMARKTKLEQEEKERLEEMQNKQEVPPVIQNLSKIHLSLQYSGDDVRPLEMFSQNYDSDDNVEEDEDETIEENSDITESLNNTADSKKEEVDNSTVEISSEKENEVSDEESKENDLSECNDVKENGVDMSNGKDDDSASDDEEIIGEDQLSSDSEEEEDEQTGAGSFTVKKMRRKSKAYAQLVEAGEMKSLTSKEKRRIERSNKRKTTGSNFYEVTNVKNRNRNKMKPNENQLGLRGHTKKKPRRK